MDLKSMLNESAPKQPPPPPPLHTTQSSFDRAVDRATPYDAPSDRFPSYPPSSHTLDSRSQPGGYFTQLSPQPHSASTPSAGTQSVYAQSPGTHGQIYTPRESGSVPPPHPYPPPAQYTRSPSSAGHPPTTPGSAHYHPGYVSQTNGVHVAARQMSPPGFTHQTPVTPLGPPTAYHRPSPQAQRPNSQGYDHFRRSSVSSIGSTHSRDYPIHHMQPETARMGSAHRAHVGDDDRQREREQSYESVSPKTIPRPTPQRQSLSYSQEPPTFDSRPPAPTPSLSSSANSRTSRNQSGEDHTNGVISQSSTQADELAHMSAVSVQAAQPIKLKTPQLAHSSLPAQPSPPVTKPTSLKRSNSMLSNPPASVMPPRKRARRDEIPIFARSARRGKPIRFGHGGPAVRAPQVPATGKRDPVPTAPPPTSNGQRATSAPAEVYQPFDPRFDPTITNTIPHEDIIRQICDFVGTTLATQTEPVPGSFFEVEAKLGAIVDPDTNQRISLPVSSETIVNKKILSHIRFASTMDQVRTLLFI